MQNTYHRYEPSSNANKGIRKARFHYKLSLVLLALTIGFCVYYIGLQWKHYTYGYVEQVYKSSDSRMHTYVWYEGDIVKRFLTKEDDITPESIDADYRKGQAILDALNGNYVPAPAQEATYFQTIQFKR